MGPLEFIAYAIATATCGMVKDPAYFATEHAVPLLHGLEHRARDAALQRRPHDVAVHVGDAGRVRNIAADRRGCGRPARVRAHDLWGATWTQQVLGF